MELLWFWWRYFKPVHREWMEDKRHLEILHAKCTFPPHEYSFTQVTFVSSGIICYPHRWIMVSSGGHYAHNSPLMHARLVWIQTQPPHCAQSIVWCRLCRPEREWHHQRAAISPRVQEMLRFMAEIPCSIWAERRSEPAKLWFQVQFKPERLQVFLPDLPESPKQQATFTTMSGHSHTLTLTHSHLRRRTNLHSIFSRLSARQPRRLRLCLLARVCKETWSHLTNQKHIFLPQLSAVFCNGDSGCFAEWTACREDVTLHGDAEWITGRRRVFEGSDTVGWQPLDKHLL